MFKCYKKILTAIRSYYKRNVQTLMQETSLHGLKFVANSSLTPWERIFFLSFFVVAIICSIRLVLDLYASWENTPVIVSTNPKPTLITEVPFPAVVICNMNVLQRSKVIKYSEHSLEGLLTRYFCDSDDITQEEIQKIGSYENSNWTLGTFLQAHSQSCAEMLLLCNFAYESFNCSEIFYDIITDDGHCCAFNYLDPMFAMKNRKREVRTGRLFQPVDWNPETGYEQHNYTYYYPTPGAASGVLMGLSVTLNAQVDEYYCSKANGAGFKFAAINPLDVRSVRDASLIAPLGSETQFRISMGGTDPAPNLRSVSPTIRKCIFNNEMSLLYSRYYTPTFCSLECEAAYYYTSCGCISYNLPNIYNASDCGFKDLSCILTAERTFKPPKGDVAKCLAQCFPSCKSLSILADSFSLPFSPHNFLVPSTTSGYTYEFRANNLALVRVYYNSDSFNTELKNVYFGLTEFLSNSGGILGLFLGFSVISIAEIIYFMLLRPFLYPFLQRHQRPSYKKKRTVTPIVRMEQTNWMHNELFTAKKYKRNSTKLFKKPRRS